jgi:2-keto-4-pentenoate hydratase/2-oxohepta-3-ene-1,7-dioic acid hydratase in catechol pathway
MRFANVSGRLKLVTGSGTVADVAEASGGRIGSSIQDAYPQWDAVLDIAARLEDIPGEDVPAAEFGNPSPFPRQVFAIGLNYADHAAETAFTVPGEPTVFTKFPASLEERR